MAVRTTAGAVQAIVEVEASISLTPFIEIANALVTEVCEPVTTYDATRLELIERWLAAHFYKIRDKEFASEQAGSVQANYQFKLGLMLQSTMYGQQALLIDTEGGLAALSKRLEKGVKKKISITSLGTNHSKVVTFESD